MLRPKEELITLLDARLVRIAINIKRQNEVIKYCHEKFKIEESILSDYIRGQKALVGAPPHILYILAAGLDLGKDILVNQFYTDAEKEMLGNESFEDVKIEFPLRFKMIKVADDSWIGPINVKDLHLLYKQQLINYNENTQRALKMAFYKGEGVYRIVVNRKAVEQIRESFHERRYIPNTITLNIPDDIENDFYYNEESCELVIRKLEMFDILDGYHRLLAMSQEMNENPDFEYPMELRITNYGVEKARQFIYQEDQKTKMRKVDSDTYNNYSLENRVVSKVNMDPNSDVQGMINVNGNIDQGLLGMLVNFFWFKGIPAADGRKIVLDVSQTLIQSFNLLAEYNNDYLVKRYTYKDILSVCYYARKIYDGEAVVGKQIYDLCQKLEVDTDVRIKTNKISKPIVNYLNRMVEEA